MSNQDDKLKNSKRRYKDEVAIKKQVAIAKQYSVEKEVYDQPHRFSKHHVLNCGNPNCYMCANPRKIFKQPTIQEQKLFQDMELISDKKSNGIKNNDQD